MPAVVSGHFIQGFAAPLGQNNRSGCFYGGKIIGAGIAPNFSLPAGQIDYMEYFYPGMILMLMLQVSISATMSVIEDRSQGFLRGVLVAPGSRAAVAVGKILGAATVEQACTKDPHGLVLVAVL